MFAGDLAFMGDFAEADVFNLGPGEADGDDAEEGNDEEHGGAGGGGFRGGSVKAGQGGGDETDLGEPADDGQLQNAGGAAEGEQQDAFGQVHAGQWGAGGEGARGGEVGAGNEQPHGDGEAGGPGEVAEGANGIEAGVEGADLVSNGLADIFGDEAEGAFEQRGYEVAGEADGDEEERSGDGEEHAPATGALDDFRMGQGAGGRDEDEDGEDEGHGAGIEEALDDVNGDLRADGQAGLFGDEVGADGVGYAADERDGGEAHDLGAEEREGRDALVVADELGPAEGAKDVTEIDAADAEGDETPVGVGDLLCEDAEVKVNFAAAPGDEDSDEGNEDEADDDLLFLQVGSRFYRLYGREGRNRMNGCWDGGYWKSSIALRTIAFHAPINACASCCASATCSSEMKSRTPYTRRIKATQAGNKSAEENTAATGYQSPATSQKE